MAEERSVGLERVTEAADADVDPTKAELQRRMEEARESISQTVSEIKDTVVTQYQQVKETISDTLDWREQYRRHTLPFTLGAFAAGALIGYSVMGAFKGGEDEDYDEEGSFDRIDRGFDEGAHSYAASPVIGRARQASAYQRTSRPESNAATESAEVFGGGRSAGESDADVGPASRPSYSSGYGAATAQQAQGLVSHASSSQLPAEEEEPKGPGLLERFKETKAYDRLTEELSTVGERVVEELSRTATTVVVPMLLNKLKGLIGVDLSGQRGGGSRQSGGAGAQSSAPQSGASRQNFTPSGAGAQESPSRPAGGPDASTSSSASGGPSARAAGAGGTEGYGAS
jgi:hypothetical protein